MLPKLTALTLLAFGALCVTSCHELFEQYCTSDADCPAGYACETGWFGSTCRRRCTTHEDCGSGYYCTGCFEGRSCSGVCLKGCRESSECSETEWCNDGTCAAGCYSDAVCASGRPGSVCVGAEPGSGPSGECRNGCVSDEDCESSLAKQCTCGACIEPCEGGSDCPAGHSCSAVPDCTLHVCTRS